MEVVGKNSSGLKIVIYFCKRVQSDIFAKVLNTSLYYDHIRQHQELMPHYFRDTTSFTSTTSLIPF